MISKGLKSITLCLKHECERTLTMHTFSNSVPNLKSVVASTLWAFALHAQRKTDMYSFFDENLCGKYAKLLFKKYSLSIIIMNSKRACKYSMTFRFWMPGSVELIQHTRCILTDRKEIQTRDLCRATFLTVLLF